MVKDGFLNGLIQRTIIYEAQCVEESSQPEAYERRNSE